MSHYHTRNQIPEEEKRAGEKQAQSQERVVLWFFRQHPGERFTPDEVLASVFGDHVPITSIRRAITNLTNEGKLEKREDDRREGQYGVSVCTWVAKPVEVQMELTLR